MTDYSELSGAELNCEIAKRLGWKFPSYDKALVQDLQGFDLHDGGIFSRLYCPVPPYFKAPETDEEIQNSTFFFGFTSELDAANSSVLPKWSTDLNAAWQLNPPQVENILRGSCEKPLHNMQFLAPESAARAICEVWLQWRDNQPKTD